jgi:cytochrome P450
MIEHEKQAATEESGDRPLTKRTLSNSEILSQAIVFLSAGFDTTGITFEWISYNLALNQDAQSTLIDEIDRVLEKHVLFGCYSNLIF